MEPREHLTKLNEIMAKKQVLLREILDCTLQQKEALSRDDFNELEILIAKKQARMDAVDRLDRRFLDHAEGLKKELGIKSLEELPARRISGTVQLKENTAGVLDLLREIKAVDDENTACLEKKVADMKEKARQSNSFKKVSAAYFQPRHGLTNPYFDEKK
jgi:hypothetical protein